MADFADGMQAAFMDKPVVDQTGLKDRYDFALKAPVNFFVIDHIQRLSKN